MAVVKSERSYGLSAADVTKLKAEYAASGVMPNPYQKGAYRFTVAALLALGADQFHSLTDAYAAFREAAGPEWFDAWSAKESRNERGKDAEGRFTQNLRVLQRTADYAKRLLDTGKRVLRTRGAVIDLARDDAGAMVVRLNLNANEPQKAGRVGNQAPAAPAAPAVIKKRPKKKPATKGRQSRRK